MALQLVGGRTLFDIRGRFKNSLSCGASRANAHSIVLVAIVGLLTGWLAWSVGDVWKVTLVGAFAAALCGFCVDQKPTQVAGWFGCAFWLGQVMALDQIMNPASTVSSFVIALMAFNFIPIVVSLGTFVGHFAHQYVPLSYRGNV